MNVPPSPYYAVKQWVRIVLCIAYGICLSLLLSLSPFRAVVSLIYTGFCMQHAKSLQFYAANEFVSITRERGGGESFDVCVHALHESTRNVLLLKTHPWIWHDNTKRRQPATMTTMTVNYETTRYNENMAQPRNTFTVRSKMVVMSAWPHLHERRAARRCPANAKEIDKIQFYLTVLLISPMQPVD